MNKIEMTEAIMAAKAGAGIGWEELSAQVGLAPVFLTSACLGMNSLKPEDADKLCAALSLPAEVSGGTSADSSAKSTSCRRAS